ncbi:AmmeMemoRadiSam system radical SAM enzyme [Candidatus Desantisbacteria bacterium]|nr:AmmeMemoRadiSam system radical SAM enzyme [Candidatus Desantisbacteria bacterium]
MISSSKIVQCKLCPKECKLHQGEKGDCRVRVNIGNKLYSLVYGKPCAVHIDPIEKKPMFHFLPGARAFSIATAGCNLHCKFCQNWEISQTPPEETNNQDLLPSHVIQETLLAGCETIAFTYSDPMIYYEYTYDTAVIAKEKGIRNILVTASYINPEPLKKLCKVIHGANVDIKSFEEKFYQNICGARLKPVLDALLIYKEEGVFVEITNLLVTSLNDDPKIIKKMCNWIFKEMGDDIPLHFSRFWPLYQLKNLPPTPVPSLITARQIAIDSGLKYVYIGNVPGLDGENTYCPNCHNSIIRRIGFDVYNNLVLNRLKAEGFYVRIIRGKKMSEIYRRDFIKMIVSAFLGLLISKIWTKKQDESSSFEKAADIGNEYKEAMFYKVFR